MENILGESCLQKAYSTDNILSIIFEETGAGCWKAYSMVTVASEISEAMAGKQALQTLYPKSKGAAAVIYIIIPNLFLPNL